MLCKGVPDSARWGRRLAPRPADPCWWGTMDSPLWGAQGDASLGDDGLAHAPVTSHSSHD